MLLRRVMIDACQPLRSAIGRRKRIGRRRELHRSPVDSGLRIGAQGFAEGRSRSTQSSERIQVQHQARIQREQPDQSLHSRCRRHHQRKIRRRPVRIVLKSGEKEGPIPDHRTADRESVDVVNEHRLRRALQARQIIDRIEPLGLITPETGAMERVGPGFRDDIQNPARRAPEFGTEVRSLHRNLLDRVHHIEGLRHTGEPDIVVVRSIDQKIIPAHALPVDRELHPRASAFRRRRS